MEWTDIRITVPKARAEEAEAIATGISGGGIYIEDYSDLEAQVEAIAHVDLIEQDLLDKPRDQVIVHMYLAPDEPPAEVLALLKDRLDSCEMPYTLNTEGVEQQDWETAWKQYYHAMDIGQRLAIVPSWEEYDTDRTVLRMDPGMAFGTGTHETTGMCAALVEKYVQPGQRVIDIGTGSGILAIAAAHMGAGEVLATDLDPVAVRVAEENVRINGFDGKVSCRCGDLLDVVDMSGDVVIANIIADVIVMLAKPVRERIVDGGLFICSGIAVDRRDDVIDALNDANYEIIDSPVKGEWAAFAARKR